MKQNKNRDAVGYVRASTLEGSEAKLKLQEEEIHTYCKRYNINLIKIFKDAGESGSHFNRKGWLELKAFLGKQRDMRFIVASRPDRISRNAAKFREETECMKKEFKIEIRFGKRMNIKREKNGSLKNFGR